MRVGFIGLAATAIVPLTSPAFAFESAVWGAAASGGDTIEVGLTQSLAEFPKPSVRRNARHIINGEGRTLLDLQRVSLHTKSGERIERIHQRWDAANKSYIAVFDQTIEPARCRHIDFIDIDHQHE